MACTFGRLLTAFVGQGGARAVATDLVRTAITIVGTLGQRWVAEIQPGSQSAFHVHRIRRRASTGEKLLVFAENLRSGIGSGASQGTRDIPLTGSLQSRVDAYPRPSVRPSVCLT
jgi:hypothetical protein